ncbi:hypothetical protein TRIUR3_24828 [Triticum urartu]|uniref:Uncharacterized protein n=1 Tax=Triticum urartu TaxID=4572 RepID=M7YX19_TRIUA|nr:hypothetical protein TRIUR3_24828 [Triticum urartu]
MGHLLFVLPLENDIPGLFIYALVVVSPSNAKGYNSKRQCGQEVHDLDFFCFFDLDAAMDEEDMALDLEGEVVQPYHHDSFPTLGPSLSLGCEIFFQQQEPSMDEDDHRDLHSDVDTPHMVELDGKTPNWLSNHVVYKGQLHYGSSGSSSGKKKCHHCRCPPSMDEEDIDLALDGDVVQPTQGRRLLGA